MMAKLTEVPPGEAGRRSATEHCAADYAEEHGLPEADHRASVKDRRGVTVSHVCPFSVTDIRLKITSGGPRRGSVTAARARRSSVAGGARLVAASTTGGARAESLSYRTERIPARRRCFGRTPRHRVRAKIS